MTIEGDRIRQFVKDLAALKSISAFNPYSDVCPLYDSSKSPEIRRSNLEEVLWGAHNNTLEHNGTALWVARDLGYNGGRRTGLAMTDEDRLVDTNEVWGNLSVQKATIGESVRERTATVVWDAIGDIDYVPFLWNTFPLHPHIPLAPFSNRNHTKKEAEMGMPFIRRLIEMLSPPVVVAIGGDAHKVLTRMQVRNLVKVRHPSYGGHKEFREGILATREMVK